MFRVGDQREWESLVERGLRGEAWALEVAAETFLDAVRDPSSLDPRARRFLAHLAWLASECESLVSWVSAPSCWELRREVEGRLGIEPERWVGLPVPDLILLRRMFAAVPVLWAEE